MKLLTINVHAWLEENQLDKLDTLANVIVDKGYDIIALQEVNQTMAADRVSRELKVDNYGLLLMERIQRFVGDTYSYFWSNSHIGYNQYDEGIALLTKLPVYEVDSFYCSQHQTADSILSRKVIGLTLGYQDTFIQVYSCHINLPNCEGEDQLDNIRTIVERSQTDHLKIFMGDFNTDAISDRFAYQAIKDLGLYDTYDLAIEKDAGITVEKAIDGWSNHAQEKRLDYIFINQERRILSSRVIFNGKYQPIISDHFGVEIEIVI